MKKYLVAALVSGSLAIPGALHAQGSIGDLNGYKNRGQCQSALAQLRNEDRPDNQWGYTNKEYNEKTKANFECQQHNGKWYIVQVDSQ